MMAYQGLWFIVFLVAFLMPATTVINDGMVAWRMVQTMLPSQMDGPGSAGGVMSDPVSAKMIQFWAMCGIVAVFNTVRQAIESEPEPQSGTPPPHRRRRRTSRRSPTCRRACLPRATPCAIRVSACSPTCRRRSGAIPRPRQRGRAAKP